MRQRNKSWIVTVLLQDPEDWVEGVQPEVQTLGVVGKRDVDAAQNALTLVMKMRPGKYARVLSIIKWPEVIVEVVKGEVERCLSSSEVPITIIDYDYVSPEEAGEWQERVAQAIADGKMLEITTTRATHARPTHRG